MGTAVIEKSRTKKEIIKEDKPLYVIRQLDAISDIKKSIELLDLRVRRYQEISKFSLSDFELKKVIGMGSFGRIILAKFHRDNEYLALKGIDKSQILINNRIQNLRSERNILKTVNFPFIIKLLLSFQETDKIYFGLEYHNGGDLFFHLQRKGKFREDLAKYYALQIYIALSHLHDKNIVYRDLKPENVIIDKHGNIKLIDFGLAKEGVCEDNPTSTMCGTLEYLRNVLIILAPEVILGEKYSFNFDWWGFGNLIYEMLHGYSPFRDNDKSGLFQKILKAEPQFSRNLSKEAVSLIKLLLQKDPERRITQNQIPFHPWFKGINLNDMKDFKVKSPFVPENINPEDFSYIDPEFLKEETIIPSVNEGYDNHDLFSEF